MRFIKKLLGAAPTPTDDGAFKPSPLALKLATSTTTDYDGGAYAEPYSHGNKRVLMVCTEERNMTMANGTKFSTGNHPVEMGLPMLHLISAGFKIDIVTPTGAPAVIEEWAMPRDDSNVIKLFRDYAGAFANPGSLENFVANSMIDDASYVAIFLPGGHGAMLGLPNNDDLGALLRWAHRRGLFTLALCHGPAALLAADDQNPFIYKGYKMADFPDAVDKQTNRALKFNLEDRLPDLYAKEEKLLAQLEKLAEPVVVDEASKKREACPVQDFIDLSSPKTPRNN